MVVADFETEVGSETAVLAGSADHPRQGNLLDRNPSTVWWLWLLLLLSSSCPGRPELRSSWESILGDC